MGSIGVAIYRSELADRLPAGLPAPAAAAARDTLGSAVAVATRLPDQLGAAVLQTAREAFVHGMQASSAIAAALAAGLTILALGALGRVRSGSQSDEQPVPSQEGADGERLDAEAQPVEVG